MGRQRMIHPSIWDPDGSFSKLPTSRLQVAFICLFSNADDEGKGRISCLTKLDFSLEEITDTVALLFQHFNLAHFYYVEEGLDLLLHYQLPKWFQYQSINRPSPSKIPNHPSFKKIVPRTFQKKYVVGEKDSENSVRAFTELEGKNSVRSVIEKAENYEVQRIIGNSVNFGQKIHSERKKERSTTQRKQASSTSPVVLSKTHANETDAGSLSSLRYKNGNGQDENRKLYQEVIDWWEELTFIPSAGRGKLLASTKKTEEEMEAIRDEIQRIAEAEGVQAMTSSAEVDYRNKPKDDKPLTLSYYIPMWRDLSKPKSEGGEFQQREEDAVDLRIPDEVTKAATRQREAMKAETGEGDKADPKHVSTHLKEALGKLEKMGHTKGDESQPPS